jgi:hypothetical protein
MFDRAAQDRFFAPFAQAIGEFVARRNLSVEKYRHSDPCWSFVFGHPLDEFATGKMSLCRTPEDTLRLSIGVWIDDHDACTRRMRFGSPEPAPMEAPALIAALNAKLDEVLAWRLDEQFQTHPQPGWATRPKRERLAGHAKYPIPTSG